MNIVQFLFFLIFTFILIDFFKKNRRISKNDPPKAGYALPILGHLLKFGKNPHRDLTLLAKKYGGIYSIYMGDIPTIVITDPILLREIWVKQFKIFSNRPHPKSYKHYSGNFNDLAFADYELWHQNRRLVSSAFTKTKIKSVSDIIERQSNYLINSMNEILNDKKLFYPKKYFSKFAINIVCSMMFSKEISQSESVDKGEMAKLTIPIQSVFKKLGADNIDDFIKLAGPFFYFENKKFKNQVQEIYQFMEEIYNQHLTNLDFENPKDLMDLLIVSTESKQKSTVIHVCLDFLLAGSDSNAAVCEWFCLYMINNPEIQKKAYSELLGHVEKGEKFIPVSKRDQCPYMISIIKEILRIKPVGPLGIPRIAMESTDVNGYYIPKGTQVIQNIYGLGNLFVSDPEQFSPERWIEYKKQKEYINEFNVDESFKNQQHQNNENNYFNDLDKVCIPFSIGNRNCPGLSLSESILFSACSNILLNFELNSYNGNKCNETEVFGLTIHPTEFPIKLIPR